MPTHLSADLVVVGGGISGASAAYRLARDGVGVVLVDARHEGQATAAGAGIISTGALRDLPLHWARLFQDSTRYYGDLISRLAEDGEGDVGYAIVGDLIIAPGPEEAERLAEVAARLTEENDRWPGAPVGEIDLLTPAEARRLFPPLAEGLGAVHTSKVGRVDGRLLRVGLHRPELLAPLGVGPPVVPQRGQIIHLDLPGAETAAYPVVSGHGSDYIVSFPPGRVVLGATREDGSGFDYRATAGGVHEILSRALAVAPGLAEGTLQEIRVGFRPASPDGMPILGAVPGYDLLYLATGFGPSGLTLGPYSADLVAAAAIGGRPPTPGEAPTDRLGPFSPSRFPAGPPLGDER